MGRHYLGMLGTAALTRERSVGVVRQGLLVPPNARLVAETWQARLLQLASTSSCYIATVALTNLLVGHGLLRSLLLVRLLSVRGALILGIRCRVRL